MLLYEKTKNFFITFLSSILVGGAFFVISIIVLISSWLIFLFFTLITLHGILIQ